MSESTPDLYATLRTRLLTFEPLDGGDSIAVRLSTLAGAGSGGKLYNGQAPDGATYPFGVLRLLDPRSEGDDSGARQVMDLELMLYHRPRSTQPAMERVADVAQQALFHWSDVASGLVFGAQSRRTTLPAAPAPMDRELVVIRLLFRLIAWPEFLLQYLTAAE